MNVVTELRKLETTKSFFARGGTGDVFPTYQSFAVFLRRHAKELCADGVFILRRGSSPSLVDARDVGAAIRRIMQREASRLAQRIEGARSLQRESEHPKSCVCGDGSEGSQDE